MSRLHIVGIIAILLVAAVAFACGDDDNGGGPEPETFGFGLEAQTIASGADAERISAIAIAPDGRIFYAEQLKGTIRVVNADGTLQPEPFTQIEVADWLGQDWGLTGLALDPDFEDNHYVYAFYTEFVRTISFTRTDGTEAEHDVGQPVLVRFTEADGVADETEVISQEFPESDEEKPGYNLNGEIHFGPDGFLYASLGDYDLFEKAPGVIQNPGSPIGSLLRLNKEDGSAAEGNPLDGEEQADTRIYAYGFREPFSFTFAPDGTLYANDNTTVSCEELNVIEAGLYYGWPEMGGFPFADCGAAPGEQPVYNFAREGLNPGDFLAYAEVSGFAYLEDSSYALLTDGLLVCESHKSIPESDGVLRTLTIENGAVTASELIASSCGGDVRVGPDGSVYYATATELRKLVDSDDPRPPDQTAPSR
ncbi:MAG TPA: PQQ-dependent sugar dehydrogenase [Dehalococcoidia bacterium]|nr:PQQ-dependent sugar dehydrogenase [Dehalococcoidia bacterium]